MVEERAAGASTPACRYDYAGDLVDMRRGTALYFYIYDGAGSTRQLTNAGGSVTDTYAYDAYGNLTAQTGTTPNSYLYDAQEQDGGTGLY